MSSAKKRHRRQPLVKRLHRLLNKRTIHRYRYVIQTLTVLLCLGWGAYQITSEVMQQSPDQAVANDVSEPISQIEAAYPNLPSGVAHAVRSVVATQQLLDADNQKGAVASGVILNDQQILTAGHSVQSDGRLACKQMDVVAAGMLTDAAASVDPVTHASVNYGKSSDLAVLTIRSSDNFQSLPAIIVATKTLRPGDTVYFINYQPTADGAVRSPALESNKDTTKDYSKPAIFTGTTLGISADGVAIATGNGKSLGIGAPDNALRKGASGGAIVNANGQLVGLSVASESLQTDRSAASLAKEFRGFTLPDGSYQLAYMQTVNRTIIANLQSKMMSCASGV